MADRRGRLAVRAFMALSCRTVGGGTVRIGVDYAQRVCGAGARPTQNVLGEVSGKQVIAVSGAKTYKDSGQLLLVTVNASGVPGYPVSNAQALVAWADSKSTVMPQEAVVPVGQTAEEYKQSSDKEMTSSQDSATAAAKKSSWKSMVMTCPA